MGEIIATVYSFHSGSAKTYNDYLKDKITGPSSKIPLSVYFPDRANDQQLPSPYINGLIRMPGQVETTSSENASGKVAEGNGVGTMADLNRFIRSVIKGTNVLGSPAVEELKNSVGPATKPENNHYALGCFHLDRLDYGHNGATDGYLSLMVYDPETDISIIVLLPYWYLTGKETFPRCINALNSAGLAARTALGYPGK